MIKKYFAGILTLALITASIPPLNYAQSTKKQVARPSSRFSYKDLASLFEKGLQPTEGILSRWWRGKLLNTGTNLTEDIVLVGAVDQIPVEQLTSGRLLKIPVEKISLTEEGIAWNDSKNRYEVRQCGSYLVLAIIKTGSFVPWDYAYFENPAKLKPSGKSDPKPLDRASFKKSPILESLASNPDPFGTRETRDAPLVVDLREGKDIFGRSADSEWKFSGDVFTGYNKGTVPLFVRGTTAPYEGPEAGTTLRLKWRPKSPSRFLQGADLSVQPSFIGDKNNLSEGRFNFSAIGDIWLKDYLGIQVGHRFSRDIGHTPIPDSDTGEDNLYSTWVGLRYTPYGHDAKTGIESYFNLHQIPGTDSYIGPNNWPARARGAGPTIGWEVGVLGKYVWENSAVKVPLLPITMRDITFSAGGALLGGTPFDDPDGLGLLAQISARLAKNLSGYLGIKGHYNLNSDVISDPEARTGASTPWGIFFGLKYDF